MIDLAVVGPPVVAGTTESVPVRSERDVVRVTAAAARGGGAHRGRAVVIVVRRGRGPRRLPLVRLGRRRARLLIRPLLAALAAVGPRLEILEALDDDPQLLPLGPALLRRLRPR